MAGLCLVTNGLSVENMIKNLNSSPYLETKESYKDDILQISQVSLKVNDFKPLVKDDIVVFVEGYVYNLEDTNSIFNLACETFLHQLIEAYKNNFLSDLLKKTNGFFTALLYDIVNKKILVISDRLGTRFTYYYHKDNLFACCGEVKGFLDFENIDRTIDKTTIECFINENKIFYPLGNTTFFENIKLINPASILEYDIESNTINSKYYWTFAEIKPSDITYEDAIDCLHDLVEKAVLRRIKTIPLNEIELPLSGGLDSRLLFAILNNHNKMPDFIYTNGVDNCTDVVYAKKLCKKYHYKHYTNYPIKSKNYVNAGKNIPWVCGDGMVTFFEQNTFNYLSTKPFLLMGYLGDVIFGKSLKEDKSLLDVKMTQEIAEKSYGKFYKLSDYESSYYDINKIEPSLLMNRLRRYTAQMVNVDLNYNECILPYIDNDIIDFIYSLPDSYRADNNLYADMLLKYYPEYFKNIPWNRNNLPIQGKIYRNNKGNINALIEKISKLRFLSPKWKNSIIKRINLNNILYLKTFQTFTKELTCNKNLKLIKKEYINNDSLLKQYVSNEVWQNILEYLSNKNAWKISLILTVEFYLRTLRDKKYI